MICIRGATRGPVAVQVEAALRTYWEAAEFTMEQDKYVDGWKIEKPNFWVIQLSIQGLRFNMARRMTVENWLRTSKVGKVTELGSAISADIKRLTNAKDPKEAQGFVNVMGGSLHGPGLDRAAAELLALDVPFSVQKGPLLLKTAGVKKGEWLKGKKRSLVPPMPILAKSTYAHLNRCLDQAYEEMIAAGGLTKYIAPENLPPEYGGTTQCRVLFETKVAEGEGLLPKRHPISSVSTKPEPDTTSVAPPERCAARGKMVVTRGTTAKENCSVLCA